MTALPEWIGQVLTGGNIVILFVLVRRISRLEFMVETMWNRSEKQIGEAHDDAK